MSLQKNSKGFSLIIVIALVLVLAIAGGSAWVVMRSNKAKTSIGSISSSTNEGQSVEQPAEQKPAEQPAVDEVANWLLFEAPNKAYKLRLPDGWKIIELNSNIYGRAATDIVYTKGTKAVVTSTEFGWDGASAFAVYFPGSYADQIVRRGSEVGTVKTDSGLTAHKYYFVQETDEEIGYQKGDKVYNYYFDNDGKSIQIEHVIRTGGTDQTELIEKVVRTLQVK